MNPDASPSPLQHGWCIREGKCTPVRYTQPALPKCLSNFAVTAASGTQESDTDSDTNLMMSLTLMNLTMSRTHESNVNHIMSRKSLYQLRYVVCTYTRYLFI